MIIRQNFINSCFNAFCIASMTLWNTRCCKRKMGQKKTMRITYDFCNDVDFLLAKKKKPFIEHRTLCSFFV